MPAPMISRGIVNGIDYDEYNPETDDLHSTRTINVTNFRKEKDEEQDRALQKELGLEIWIRQKMMIGIVSRLTDQKGFDLIRLRDG